MASVREKILEALDPLNQVDHGASAAHLAGLIRSRLELAFDAVLSHLDDLTSPLTAEELDAALGEMAGEAETNQARVSAFGPATERLKARMAELS